MPQNKTTGNAKKQIVKLNDAEVMTILMAFGRGDYCKLKFFYINYVQKYLAGYFLEIVAYYRFIE